MTDDLLNKGRTIRINLGSISRMTFIDGGREKTKPLVLSSSTLMCVAAELSELSHSNRGSPSIIVLQGSLLN